MGTHLQSLKSNLQKHPQNQQKCPNKHAPTQLSSFKMKVLKSLLTTSKSSSKLLAFQSNHSGQDFLPKLCPHAMSLNSLPTLVQVSVLLQLLVVLLPLLVVPLKKHQKKKPRKKSLKKNPTPIWDLIFLDKTLRLSRKKLIIFSTLKLWL